jgi:hypothetical protein
MAFTRSTVGPLEMYFSTSLFVVKNRNFLRHARAILVAASSLEILGVIFGGLGSAFFEDTCCLCFFRALLLKDVNCLLGLGIKYNLKVFPEDKTKTNIL